MAAGQCLSIPRGYWAVPEVCSRFLLSCRRLYKKTFTLRAAHKPPVKPYLNFTVLSTLLQQVSWVCAVPDLGLDHHAIGLDAQDIAAFGAPDAAHCERALAELFESRLAFSGPFFRGVDEFFRRLGVVARTLVRCKDEGKHHQGWRAGSRHPQDLQAARGADLLRPASGQIHLKKYSGTADGHGPGAADQG